MLKNIIHNQTIDAIIKRRTVRAFKDEQISDRELQSLLTAALWAPSGRNTQPCHVRVLQDKKALEKLNVDFKNLVGWDTPAYTRWDVNPVYQTAPSLFFIFAEDQSDMAAGLMAQNIAIAAESIGLGTCIIGSVGLLMNAPEGEKWKEKLGILKDWRFLIAVAVGYKDEEPPVKERNEDQFKVIKELS